jgi:hypothetical protein
MQTAIVLRNRTEPKMATTVAADIGSVSSEPIYTAVIIGQSFDYLGRTPFLGKALCRQFAGSRHPTE